MSRTSRAQRQGKDEHKKVDGIAKLEGPCYHGAVLAGSRRQGKAVSRTKEESQTYPLHSALVVLPAVGGHTVCLPRNCLASDLPHLYCGLEMSQMDSEDMAEEEGRRKWQALVWSEMRRCCRTVGAEERKDHYVAEDRVVERRMAEGE